MLKNIFAVAAIFIIGMTGGIFSSQIFWPYLVKTQIPYQSGLERGPVYLTETKQIYIQENIALIDAIERTEKTVIAVRTKTQAGKILEGSGFVITSDGLIITLAELVPYDSEFSFFVNNKKVSFQILKRDLKENLALIKISNSTLTTAGFARLENLKIGERVFLIGAIFENGTYSKSVNEGIIKAFKEDSIQTSIVESNLLSGSPLFNIKGEVLGISAIDAKGNVRAIPISKIRALIGM